MMVKDKIFLDTNILVYFVNADSEFHSRTMSKIYEIEKNSEFFISTQVLREYAVCITRSSLFGKNSVADFDVTSDIQKFSDSFELLGENLETMCNLIELIRKYHLSGKIIHDANIVACMKTNNISKILTHNIEDFKRFTEIEPIGIE